MFYGFDWTYVVFILPCVIISLICQINVSSTFSKYSQMRNSRNMTGAQAAEFVLRQNGVYGVRIERVAGNLTDHFDPRTNVIRLSDSVYNANTVAAVGVACHEAGHAVQHAQNYLPNKIRSAILPMANIGSKLSWFLIILGLCFSAKIGFVMLYIGIALFGFSVLFTLQLFPLSLMLLKERLKLSKTEICFTVKNTRVRNALAGSRYDLCCICSYGNFTAFKIAYNSE